MIIESFRDFSTAKSTAQKYAAGGKKHPGLAGIRYSVHHYFNGEYIVVRANGSISSRYGTPIYTATV